MTRRNFFQITLGVLATVIGVKVKVREHDFESLKGLSAPLLVNVDLGDPNGSYSTSILTFSGAVTLIGTP